MEYAFTVAELQKLLIARGLPRSGRKTLLIQRLISADPEAMRNLVAGPPVFAWTAAGRLAAEVFLAAEKQIRERAEQCVLKGLIENQLEAASCLVAKFEASQVFPRGLGMNWEQHNPARNVFHLKIILETTPRIVGRHVGSDRLPPLRLAAAMMYLWGARTCFPWLPKPYETGSDMDPDTAARMLLFHASHHESLANYRKLASEGLTPKWYEVLRVSDPTCCECCRALPKRFYSLKGIPELPHPNCTAPLGCRCTLVANF
jgi:hypothetical protein